MQLGITGCTRVYKIIILRSACKKRKLPVKNAKNNKKSLDNGENIWYYNPVKQKFAASPLSLRQKGRIISYINSIIYINLCGVLCAAVFLCGKDFLEVF